MYLFEAASLVKSAAFLLVEYFNHSSGYTNSIKFVILLCEGKVNQGKALD